MPSSCIAVLCEGQTEEILIKFLKTDFYQIRQLSFCKQHSKYEPNAIHKCIKHSNLKRKCCKTQIIIFDKDENSDEFINKIKRTLTDVKVVVSYPCIEIVLLNFFTKDCSNTHTNKSVSDKLSKELKSKSIKDKYEHNKESIKKICEYMYKNKDINYNQWKNNLRELKKHNISNFIDVIELFEKLKDNENDK